MDILFADDDKWIQILVREEFGSDKHRVAIRDNCQGIWDFMKRCRPDIVITEAVLGGCNVLDHLAAIRNKCYDLPLILWTRYNSFRYDPRVMVVDYYIQKKMDLTELKSKIHMALESVNNLPVNTTFAKKRPDSNRRLYKNEWPCTNNIQYQSSQNRRCF